MEEHSKRTSVVWNYFTAVDGTMATCDICSMRLSYKSTVSNLKKHINRKHPDAIRPGGNGATASGRADDEYYAVNTPTVKSRPVRSPMWKYFTKVDDNFANCELCSKRLSFRSTVSNLVKHLHRRHADTYAAMKRDGAEGREDKYAVFSDQSSDGDRADQQSSREDRLWTYFELETGGRARCALCRTALPTHPETLSAHLEEHHSELGADRAQESDAELEGEDNELISEIVYLEDGNDEDEKKYTTLIDHDQRSDAYKRRKRHRDDDAPSEKYRLPKLGRNSMSSTEDDRPVLLVASGKKDNEEADAFSKYLMQLMKSLPKHIQTKLQMEIVNVVMKAKMEYEAKQQEREDEEKNAASVAKDSRYSVTVARDEPLRRVVCRKSEIDTKKDSDVLDGIIGTAVSVGTEDGAMTSEVGLPATFTGIHSL